MHKFKTKNPVKIEFKNNQALHGDVILTKTNELPEGFNKMEKEPNDALAYGEVTGHSHKLFKASEHMLEPGEFQLRQSSDGTKFLLVEKPVELRHQEHDPRIIPEGFYKIGIQREYDPFTKKIREVAD